MNKNLAGILSLSCLVLAALACQAVPGGGGNNGTPRPTATQRGTGKVLLSDYFTSEQWGTGTDSDSSIEYANGALEFIVYSQNWFTWSTPNDTTYQNVRIEVTAINKNSDPTTALGIMCKKQPSEESFYYFAVTPGGEYAIAKASAGKDDVYLTNNDEWATSDLIAKNASAYRLGADCANGRLTLSVDGQAVDSVVDTTYQGGGVGLFVWSGEQATNTDIAFDDFLMSELP